MTTMKMMHKISGHLIIIEITAVILCTTVLCFFTKEEWMFLLGGIAIALMIIFSVLQRRRYERDLEQVTEYIDLILTDKHVDAAEPLSDNMISKLGHQLAKLQKMVVSYNEDAKRDKQDIRDLIVEIAHQLRMPIANIDTYLDLLTEKELDEEERLKYIHAIDISTDKLIFLIENFIKMSRLESNIIQIRKSSTDIAETIDDEKLQVGDKAGKKQIHIRFDKPDHISVPHDKSWLGESISNILDNCVKYSPPGSDIRISLTQNGMFTEINITDEGPPIPLNEENLIFKRFYRGSNVEDQEGFGLGLYLTREIVLKHDGFIKFKNIKDGHSFSIFLPA